MEGQNFFILSDVNEVMFIPVLYNNKQAHIGVWYIYEFIMGNKHEVLRSKAKVWGSGAPCPPLPTPMHQHITLMNQLDHGNGYTMQGHL